MPTPRRAIVLTNKHKPATSPAFAHTKGDGMLSIRVPVCALSNILKINGNGLTVHNQLKSLTRRATCNLQASDLRPMD